MLPEGGSTGAGRMDIESLEPAFRSQIEGRALPGDIGQETLSFPWEENEGALHVRVFSVLNRGPLPWPRRADPWMRRTLPVAWPCLPWLGGTWPTSASLRQEGKACNVLGR